VAVRLALTARSGLYRAQAWEQQLQEQRKRQCLTQEGQCSEKALFATGAASDRKHRNQRQSANSDAKSKEKAMGEHSAPRRL